MEIKEGKRHLVSLGGGAKFFFKGSSYEASRQHLFSNVTPTGWFHGV